MTKTNVGTSLKKRPGWKIAALFGCGGLVGICACLYTISVVARASTSLTTTPRATATAAPQATNAPPTLIPTVTKSSSATRAPTKTSTPTERPVSATATRPPTDTAPPPISPSEIATQPQPQPTQALATNTNAPPPPTAAPAWSLISLTSPINAGADATLVIQTSAGASCFLSYVTPSGSQSGAAGLGATTANDSGVCAWTWRISSSTNPGTGRLSITASGVSGGLDIVIQ